MRPALSGFPASGVYPLSATSLIGVALAIAIAGKLSHWLAAPWRDVPFIWLPAGLAVVVVMVYGNRALWAVFLGHLLAYFLIFAGAAVPSVALALASTAECYIVASLFRRMVRPSGQPDFRKMALWLVPVAFGASLLRIT